MITVTVVLTLLSALGADAFPTAPKSSPGSFTAERVKNPDYRANGAAHLARAYRKFGKEVPQHIQLAAARTAASLKKRGFDDPSETDKYGTEWLTPITIGGKTYKLDFDTGSSDLWVFGAGSGSTGHTTYTCSNPAKGLTWDITYGDGSSASGNVCMAAVTIGGYTVKNQAVEVATSSNGFDSDRFPGDGLLGLAFSNINTVSPTPQKVFVDNALSQNDGKWEEPGVFTADLRPDGGSYTFGKCTAGSVKYFSIDRISSTNGFWQWDSANIADTGTTLLLLPDTKVKAYYKNVKGAKNSQSDGGWVFPCSATLPDWSEKHTKSGYTFNVPGKYMNFAPTEEGSSTCYGGLQSSSGIGINIYGDTVLKTMAVCHDYKGKRLGFGSKPSSRGHH